MTAMGVALAIPATAQLQWEQMTPVASPPAREFCAAAYDVRRAETVVFGGNNGSVAADTWTWNGTAWTQRASATSPSPRWQQVMAYDAARGRAILFGGYGSGQSWPLQSDTWEWDGTNWTQRSPPTVPPPRALQSMTFDSSRGVIVMFGGYNSRTAPWTGHADTWEWNGTDWTQRFPVNGPPARAGAAMAYDPNRRKVVLFGGGNAGRLLADTWEWDGTNWTPINTPTAPAARGAVSMVWDPALRKVVLFGGGTCCSVFRSDTWTWDGSTWTPLVLTPSPPGRYGFALAYDRARGRTVLFGGYDGRGYRSDTWEAAPPTNIVGAVTARPGTTHALTLMSPASPGFGVQAASSLGTGPIAIGRRQLQLSPDAVFVASATGVLPTVFRGFAGVLSAVGRASCAIAIPNVAGLVGTDVHTAFVVLGPSAPLGIQAISTTHTVRIVP